MSDVAVIIATHDRERLLLERSFASVRAQTRPPERLLIMNDGAALTPSTRKALLARPTAFQTELLPNCRGKGYSGALNSALLRLREIGFDGFVAILDDDDTWDADHLSANLDAAEATESDAAVSGLRLLRDGELRPRELISTLKAQDFYCGNPGWQGSNTFVRLTRIVQAGGFREGLVSCNDRDLAIRLLHISDFTLAFTGKWTATWHMERNRPALSDGRSAEKLAGLQGFWSLHEGAMSPELQENFFTHAETRFGFTRAQIDSGAVPNLQLLNAPSA